MITTQCSKETPGARETQYGEYTVFLQDTYQNCVLETYERNGYDDSDFYAIVWDEPTQSVKTIEYATTRGWTYANGASVDATPEVRAKAEAFYIRQATAAFLFNAKQDAAKPNKGKTCRVIKGRKIAKGTTVEVIGLPVGRKYSLSRWASTTYTVLVRLPDGSLVHTNVANLEVLNPEAYYLSEEVAAKRASEEVKRVGNFRSQSLVGIPANLLAKIA